MPLDPERARSLTGLVKTPVDPRGQSGTSPQDIQSVSPQAPAGQPLGDSPVVPGPKGDQEPAAPHGESVEDEIPPTVQEMAERLASAHLNENEELSEHYRAVLADLGYELTEVTDDED